MVYRNHLCETKTIYTDVTMLILVDNFCNKKKRALQQPFIISYNIKLRAGIETCVLRDLSEYTVRTE